MLTFYKLLIAIATTTATQAPATPLTTANGRPACGNVMRKSKQSMSDCTQVATR